MKGCIYLEDGTFVRGSGFGARDTRVGELVFNTSMSGYEEILTDPSYMGQIITMTYPLIGNYGINSSDRESEKVHAFGFVAKDISYNPSNAASEMNIDRWLAEEGVPGVFGIDTRKITRRIRREGTVKCVISTEDLPERELKRKLEESELRGDWMKEASRGDVLHIPGGGHRIGVMDFGVKANIIRNFEKRDMDIYIFPYGTSAEEMLAVKPEGIFLTNGPGDPECAVEAVTEVKKLIGKIPLFGICMGHQILGLALGGKTYKLRYGHRGGNHGVYDRDRDRSYITSQNHGYAVDAYSFDDEDILITHVNLNDGTCEGLRHRNYPLFSVQFHPESSPGPEDTGYLFDRFVKLMESGYHG